MTATELQPLRPHRSSADATFVWDGFPFDLSLQWRDRSGAVWAWTGARNGAGEPLMAAADGLAVLPLPDLYRVLWPLIPQLPPAPLDFGLGGAA